MRSVSASCCDYEDPRTGKTSRDGLLIKLKISNTKVVFPKRRLRLFEESKNESNGNATAKDKLPSRRRSTRTLPTRNVTPSPTVSKKESSPDTIKSSSESETNDKDNDNRKRKTITKTAKASAVKAEKKAAPATKKPKRSSSKSRSNAAPDKVGSNGTGAKAKEKNDDELLITLKKPAARKRKAPAKKAPKKKGRQEQDSLFLAPESDSDDEKDRPFRIEFATTGRATCKGCDERIEKNSLRVASRPLFRGKPGFVVYRHLKCQTFPEEITKAHEVGGWRRLKPEDRALLREQLEESKLRLEEESQELDADELVQTAFQGSLRDPPPGLTASLLPFQREGVGWMHNQEHSEVAGGILADEMGMGKTLQTITTILDNRPKLQHAKPGTKHPPSAPDLIERKREESLWADALKSCHYDLEMADVPKQMLAVKKKKGVAPIGVRAGTLVVCPLIALYQWKEEIEKFTKPDALTICIYHGNDRHEKFPREMLSKYDIVLTTYQVLEADFRKMVSPNKVKCPNCGRAFKIDKLGVHLKYFCGETAQRTAAQARQRRSADHHQRRGNNNNNKRSKSNTKKKMPMTTTKKRKTFTKTKKVVRAHKTKGFDSDSELSLPEDFDVTTKRPSRSAAKAASKRLSASSKDWGGGGGTSDSEGFSSDDLSSDDESSDDNAAPMCTIIPTKGRGKTAKNDRYDSSSDSESEDGSALKRVRKRQKAALSMVKKNVKIGSTLKKGKLSKGKATSGKKKFSKKDSGDDSSDDSSDDNAGDPLDGIDMAELKEQAMQGCRVSVLHSMSWWRIVLDEAHYIKSRSSSTSSAAFHLTGIHRWALSGTPLQNRVGELYSLIRFLRIDPMAHYFCRSKDVDCKSIYYRMEYGKCKNCGCASTQHFSYFNKHVLNVIQREGYSGDGRRAMMKLKNEVLDKALLRRTKESRAEDLNLPPRNVTIKPIRLHPREEDFYNALYTQTKSSFDDYVAEGTLLNNYAHIFDLLTKMRQAVDHPYLIVHSKKNHNKIAQGGPAVANGSTICEICEETPTDRVLSTCCNSAFCRSCVVDMMTVTDVGQGGTRCPCCRAPFSIDLNQTSQQVVDNGTLTVNDTAGMPSLKEMRNVASGSILRRINLAEFSTSTKLEALVEELYAMRKERQGSKALVFSQFTSMLDLCRWRLVSDPYLRDLGLGVRIIHGGMNVQSRDEALKSFKEDPSVRVLLMSLKAGGVALNLTVANEAYLLDPWWNPAAEMQAIDRTHRLGQFRSIRAVRFIAEGTVEERVLQLQEKKRLVFDGTIGRDAASLKMLTVDDMKALFT
eukprot:CAMPEP_0116148846 /NCGR_PEP_ID=MMETSP0329-20121206/18598_1 /TAXON_ID=697910 /ORGANISM="Pseudo-nitzschia arenysensis, Strain B593" /LENGTH=1297 /DNA_ID=CAMNT_0003645053 /DNA_START=67 /DNA_END=3960 /DNA_ORIENTATION=+